MHVPVCETGFVRDTGALEIHPYIHHSGAKFRSCVHNSAMETNDRVSFLECSLFTSPCACTHETTKELHHACAPNFSAKLSFLFHIRSNTKVMSLIPRECINWSNLPRMHCKLLCIKTLIKCIKY